MIRVQRKTATWGCLCDNWKLSFLPRLIFNWRTFSRRVTARWWPQWIKNQVSTNQNSRNRWCQIVRRTVCLIQNNVKFQWSVFIFFDQRFPGICLNKVPIVFVLRFILFRPDYRRINFQRIPHFPVIIPIFHGESFGGVNSRNDRHILLCSVAPEDDQLPLMLSCWWSIDLLIIFFFISWLYTDPHEHFNLYTPGELFGINLSLFSYKIFLKLGPVWNAILNPKFCISFLISDLIFGIQGKLFVCFLLLLLSLLVPRVFFSKL